MLLSGIFSPICTPFYPEGAIYYKKLESECRAMSRTPIAGIVVQGSTGEAIILSDEERRQVLKVAIDSASDRKVMIAGSGIESAIETLRLTEYAATLGYDVAMVRTPHYFKNQMKPENMFAFAVWWRISPNSRHHLQLPQATGYDISAELVIELADHPNLIGIKESSGNVEKVKKMSHGHSHVKRAATVTEAFEAVTPRMLRTPGSANSQSGELIPVGALAGSEDADRTSKPKPQPSSSAVNVIGGTKTRQKEVGFQVLVGAAHQLAPSLDAGAAGAILAFDVPLQPPAMKFTQRGRKETCLCKEEADRIAKPSQRVVGELGVPGVKYSMDVNGYFGGFHVCRFCR